MTSPTTPASPTSADVVCKHGTVGGGCALCLHEAVTQRASPSPVARGELQEFEKHPELAKHIERLGNYVGVSLIQWDAFLQELNRALRPPSPPATVDDEVAEIAERNKIPRFSAGEFNEIVERMPPNFGKMVAQTLDQYTKDIALLLIKLRQRAGSGVTRDDEYARGVADSLKAVTGKHMVGPSPIGALHGIGWNAAIGCAVESIRALTKGT